MENFKFKKGDKVKVIGTNRTNETLGKTDAKLRKSYIIDYSAYNSKGKYYSLKNAGVGNFVLECDLELVIDNKQEKEMKKKFKNTFKVVSEKESLLTAFITEAENIGWKNQIKYTENTNLFFNATIKGVDLQIGNFWSNDSGMAYPIYTLPQQWDEAMAAASELVPDKEKLEVGDYLYCIPKMEKIGGIGYKEDKVGLISKIEVSNMPERGSWFYRFTEDSGVFSDAVRKATEEEIKEYLSSIITISGYSAEVEDNKIVFGCQKFSLNQLSVYKDLLERKEFKTEIKINDTIITKEILEKLINKLIN